EGNDRLIGDGDVLITAVIQGALVSDFAAPTAGNVLYAPSLDLVRVDALLGYLDAGANVDTLLGGLDNDELTGDNALHLAAVVAGGDAVGSSLTPYFKLGVDIESLAGEVELEAAADALNGGDGNDDLIGDQSLDAAVIVSGKQPADGVR